MHASVYRNTRFELRLVQQGPNSFGVICAERGVHGRQVPELEIPEEDFSDEEMAQVHAVFEMLEKKFEARHADWEVAPERLHSLINEAAKAKTEADKHVEDAKTQVDLAMVTKQQIDMESEEKRKTLAALDQAHLEKQALLSALDAEIAKRKDEHASKGALVSLLDQEIASKTASLNAG